MLSGEAFGNYLGTTLARAPVIGPSFVGRQPGTRIAQTLGNIPVIGGVAERAFQFGGTPLAPLTRFGVTPILAASAGGVGAHAAARQLGAPEWAQNVADVAGTIAAPAAAPALGRALSPVSRYGRDVGRALGEPLPLRPGEAQLNAGIPRKVPPPLPDDIAALVAKKARGEALTPEELAMMQERLTRGPAQPVETAGPMLGGAGGEPPRPPTSVTPPPTGPPVPPLPSVPGVPPEDAFIALRDALAAEIKLRRSGVPAREIATGRARQAARLASAQDAANLANASLSERIAAGRAALKVGRLRQTFQQPLELMSSTVDALGAHLAGVLGPEGRFTAQNGLEALNALVKGENVQPAQIRLLQRVFGNDIGPLIQQANTGRVVPNVALDAVARAEVAKAIPGEKQIAALEQKAFAQFKHADALAADLTMNPTNARLRAVEAAARARGVRAQTLADELLARRTDALTPRPLDKLEAIAKRNQSRAAVASLRTAELARRAGQTLTEDQVSLLAAREQFGRKLAVGSSSGRQVMATVAQLIEGDRAILDAIKNDKPFGITVVSLLNGDPADSFVTAAMLRRNLARSVYERQGVQPEIAGQMAKVRFEQELRDHYGGTVPQVARDLINRAQATGASGIDTPGFLATLVQRYKNTQFGFDFGIAGIQGLNAVRRDPIGLMFGSINRGLVRLSLPHVHTEIAGSSLDRMTQLAIDGVHMASAPSAVRPEVGTVLRYYGKSKLPGASKVLAGDMVIEKAVGGLNKVQFEKVLGTLRNTDAEGHLVMLKLLGRDIQNPRVRAEAAENANAITSFARAALNGTRRNVENILLISSTMTRARVNVILQMLKLVTPGASVEQRILAASQIVGTYVIYTAIGKWINDHIGTTDFQPDPSKPGYGIIRSQFTDANNRNMLIDIVPQDSVERAFAVSIRALADPTVDDAEAQRAWERVLLGSGSVVTRGALAIGTRTGYEPGKGYRYSTLSRSGAIQSVLPAPPALSNAFLGAGPLDQALGTFGISSYPETTRRIPSLPGGAPPIPRLPRVPAGAR